MCTNRFINNSFNNNTTTLDDDNFSPSSYGLPSNLRYGSAYVPVQTFKTVYSPAERLKLWNNVSRTSKNLLSKSIFS